MYIHWINVEALARVSTRLVDNSIWLPSDVFLMFIVEEDRYIWPSVCGVDCRSQLLRK